MSPDLNGCDPLYVMCPTCGVDAGTACLSINLCVGQVYHAGRVDRALLPDMSGDAPSKEAFDKAVDASGLISRNGSRMAGKLTQKQQRFVAEYLANGLNAKQAYISAGYAPKDAGVSACQLLKNPKVAAIVSEKTGRRLAKLEITTDSVLQELAKLAFFDPRKFFNSDGSAKQVAELDDDTAMALAGMEIVELFEGNGEQKHAYGLSKKFRLVDKGLNLERLGRHLKLFTDKVEQSGEIGIRSILIPQRTSTKPSAAPGAPDFG